MAAFFQELCSQSFFQDVLPPSKNSVESGVTRYESGKTTKPSYTQKRVLKYFIEHQGSSSVEAAYVLKLKSVNVRVALCRLRKRVGIENYCPECFKPTLELSETGKCCKVCGLILHRTVDENTKVVYDNVAPNELHPNKKLGSHIEYKLLRKQGIVLNTSSILEAKVDDLFTVRMMSGLWSLIKDLGLSYQQTSDFARKVRGEIGRKVHSKRVMKNIYVKVTNELDVPHKELILSRINHQY